MNQKIAFLLEAGASAEQIAVARDLGSQLSQFDPSNNLHENRCFTHWARHYGSSMPSQKKKMFDVFLDLFLKGCKMLQEALREQEGQTLDMLGKGYFMHGHLNKFLYLKGVLTTLISIEQVLKRRGFNYEPGNDGRIQINSTYTKCHFDKRYYSFWMKLLRPENNFKLPPNVNIMSWNYDVQPELSYRAVIQQPSLQLD